MAENTVFLLLDVLCATWVASKINVLVEIDSKSLVHFRIVPV